ncbi:MtrB/PioB family decaheme-associated outer membrane protein [Kaarinaea lacus]
MQRRTLFISTILPIAAFSPAKVHAGESNVESVTSQWQCKWCPTSGQSQNQGEVKAGLGYVSNDSFKHGDYTGLHEKGAYVIADADASHRGKNSVDIEAYNLGLDSRYLSIESKLVGGFDVDFLYDQLPKFYSDTTRTPYSGGTNQQLPTVWNPAGTTGAMADLSNSLRDVDIYTTRKTFAFNTSYNQNEYLSYDLNFQRQTKEGDKALGLSLGSFWSSARSAILATPVDYVTDQAEAKFNFKGKRWHTSVAYLYSQFKNESDAIRWENAFNTPAGVTDGQAALEPSNSFNQITVTGSYQPHKVVSGSALFAVGQMIQNEDYLPYTVDASTADLPKTSLHGKINTYDFNFGVDVTPIENLILEAGYNHHEQDNNTDQAEYTYVAGDQTQTADPRTNQPYSFRQQQVELGGRYRLLKKHVFSLDYDYEIYNRTFQSVEKTEEHTLAAGYRARLLKIFSLGVKLESSDRSGDDYKVVNELEDPENPLMRKFNLADRNRDKANLRLGYHPIDQLELGFVTEYAKDKYDNSEIGLQDSEELNYTVDISYAIATDVLLIRKLGIYANYSNNTIESNQVGEATGPWQAKHDDQIDIINLGINDEMIKDKLVIELDYVYADSIGKIEVIGSDALPDLKSKRHTMTLSADYKLTKKSAVQAYYRYEKYEETNWAVDGILPNSIGNVLTMGEASPEYDIGVFALSYSYAF